MRLALALLLGAGIAAGQAPFNLWWAALPALFLVTALVSAEARRAQAVWLGWAAGAGYGAASLFWIVEPFLIDIARHGWMAPFALVLMAAGMGVFWALAAALSVSGGRTRGGRALGFALGLAAADLVRGYLFTGFPWALLGHVWIGTPVMQTAALVGPIGLSLLATIPAALPLLSSRLAPRAILTVCGACILAASWAFGTSQLAATDAPRDPGVRVRLIQPNADQHLKWRGDMWAYFLDRQIALTGQPPKRPLDLVVWPETAIPFLLDQSGSLFEEIAVASGGVPVASGVQRREGNRFFNSLAVADGAGKVFAVYDKHRLVPFGEYIPYGDTMAKFGITAFAAQQGFGYTSGPSTRVLDLGKAGRVLPLICYEAVFPQDLNAAPERADWILQVTNDGWFGKIAGPYQHLAQAQLRAVEQGLPLLRAANTGVTAVIDARGRLLQSLPLGTEGVLDADVPPALPATIYSRTGDLPATIFVVLALLALFFRDRRQSH
ncbi:MAG: apolipoprotein N-acyltransferase [Paracoccaceae bacterium]